MRSIAASSIGKTWLGTSAEPLELPEPAQARPGTSTRSQTRKRARERRGMRFRTVLRWEWGAAMLVAARLRRSRRAAAPRTEAAGVRAAVERAAERDVVGRQDLHAGGG